MIASPHDGLAKLTFAQVEHARGELRAIVGRCGARPPAHQPAVRERKIGPQAKDMMMTIAEQFREEGRQEARQQRIEEGRQEGRQEALLFLHRQRFPDAVTPQIEQRVAAAPRALLHAWISRLLSAATLAELLDD